MDASSPLGPDPREVPSLPLEPPQVPGYRLTRLLGRGSSAQVWRARRVVDDELVAIKVVPDLEDGAGLREWQALVQGAGEHIIAVHEVCAIDHDGPALALVMEHIGGGTLESAVLMRGYFTAGEIVTALTPVARALHHLHERGIVHGDLSPTNVLLDSLGRPVIADLGVAGLIGSDPQHRHGTDGFIAPEVVMGELPGAAADVHALGALAWWCATGRAPGQIAEREDLEQIAPHLPASMREVIEAAVAGDPEQRPAADDLAVALYGCAEAQPLRLAEPGDLSVGLTRRLREAADLPRTTADGEPLPWHRLAAMPAPARRWGWLAARRPRRAAKAQDRRPPKGTRPNDPAGSARPIPTRGSMANNPSSGRALGIATDRGSRRAARHGQPGGGRARSSTTARELLAQPSRTPHPAAIAALAAAAIAGYAGLAAVTAEPAPAHTQVAASQATADPAAPAQGVSGTPSPSRTPTTTKTAPEPASKTAAGATSDPLRDSDAPRTRPREVVAALSDRRVAALVDRDLGRIADFAVEGSSAAQSDEQLIAALRAQGRSYRGLQFDVGTAVLRGQGERSAVLRARLDTSSYVVAEAGEGQDDIDDAAPLGVREAARGELLDLHLRRTVDGWRVAEIRPAPAG